MTTQHQLKPAVTRTCYKTDPNAGAIFVRSASRKDAEGHLVIVGGIPAWYIEKGSGPKPWGLYKIIRRGTVEMELFGAVRSFRTKDLALAAV